MGGSAVCIAYNISTRVLPRNHSPSPDMKEVRIAQGKDIMESCEIMALFLAENKAKLTPRIQFSIYDDV
jgi:hypothetical protein